MRRRLFNFSAGVSLLLCIGMLSLWLIDEIVHPDDWGFMHQVHPRVYWEIVASICCFALVTAVLPTRWAVVHRRNRIRKAMKLCEECGYSLTGNTSGVCPECGTPVPKEPANESPRPA